MLRHFVRPSNIPYPNVWLTFEAPDENGHLEKYRIQDLPPERFMDALKHLQGNYFLEETICRARNMVNDEASVDDFAKIYGDIIYQQRMSLACFKEGCDEIIGVNVLFVDQINDKMDWEGYKSEHVKDMDLVAVYMYEQFDIFKHHEVDRFLSAYGMSVLPKYRRRGVGLKLLEARKFLGKACGLLLTSNIFSSNESQKLAQKAGLEKDFEISFEELAKKSPHYSFNVSKGVTYAIYSMRL